jgi:L-alanine-DL-glutamate epimerase-like enolase superfamily enzyme
MRLNYKLFYLQFKHPFGVSANTRKETPTIFIELESKDAKGYGEACLPLYLGEAVDATLVFFEKAKLVLNDLDASNGVEEILFKIENIDIGCNAAKAAIDIALNDLTTKIQGKPYCEVMNHIKPVPKQTSFTIGIGDESIIEQKINAAQDFSILKIKAGTINDKKLISTIRKFTHKPLYIDVNQGWKDKQYVLEMLHWMKDQGVVLAEQPMPVAMKEEMIWITKQSPIPTIADESVKRLKDLEQLDESFTGINIKLMKCTGLNEAIKMIDYCKKKQIKILLGCMAESSCGTSAMAQLMGFADYIDLDAPLLYKNDPFEGVFYADGDVCLPDALGIGAKPKQGLFN